MKTTNNTAGKGQKACHIISNRRVMIILMMPIIWGCITAFAIVIVNRNAEKKMQIEFERGAMFTVHYHHKHDYYPSMGLRQHIYENPGLGWDSLTVKYEADAKKWYDQWRKSYVNKKPVFKLRPQ